MFKNYFKVAWRSIRKNKLFSAINILGLSIGMALCFIILLFVQDELSYDRFYKNADNVARVIFKANTNGGKISESSIMAPVAQTMKRDFPEVQDATRIMQPGSGKIFCQEKVFKNERIAFADSNFFSLFNSFFIEGNEKTALLQPHTVVITKSTAEKYFGKESAIGKTIALDRPNETYNITGVMEDVPSNSHFHFDLFASMSSWELSRSDSWMFGNFHTYLLLKPGADLKKMQAKLPAMVEKYMGQQIQESMGLSLSQFRTQGNELGFALQPLTSIHLNSYTSTEFEAGGSKTYVYIFGAIAVFMLAVACINFINLSTAGASKRAKEVGVRKVAGSTKYQLVKQFLSESLIIAMLALIVALVLVQLALPAFNSLSG